VGGNHSDMQGNHKRVGTSTVHAFNSIIAPDARHASMHHSLQLVEF